jgi:hypothetical protein
MDSLHEWVTGLARDVAPDEVDLAPGMLDAYLAGGPSRQALFADAAGPAGGFDSSVLTMLMPVVFHAARLAGPALGTLLLNKKTDYLLGCLKSSLSITELGLKGRKLFGLKEVINSKPPDGDAAASGVTALMAAGETICTELRARGLSNDQSDAIAYRVLIRLLEDPKNAEVLVRRIAASSR